MRIDVIFVGALHDGGFNAAALQGAERARSAGHAEINIVSGLTYDTDAMRGALQKSADTADGIVFIGGQGNAVVPDAASAFPDRAFAIVQGEALGPNLSSYDVLQEQSAFLAGCLAARMTRTGIVAHLSGHRVTPGLKGRAAYAAGIRHLNPEIRLLTSFCGTQDDSAVTAKWTEAMAAEGADIVFTMLNAARDGATAACRKTGLRQIGNVADWSARDPAIYLGSAVARIDMGVTRAIADICAGHRPEMIVRLGLADKAVALATAPDVPAEVVTELEAIATSPPVDALPYEGPEFDLDS